jgi:hypothetical protein
MTDRPLTNFQLTLYGLGFLLLFGSWMVVAYNPPKDGGAAIVGWIINALSLLAGHILGTAGTKARAQSGAHGAPPLPASSSVLVAAPPAQSAQGGYAAWPLLLIISTVLMLAGSLQGCAGLNAQGVLTITYNTPAVTTSATLVPGVDKPASKP